MKEYIDNTVKGIIEEVGSNNLQDILSHLGIHLIRDNSTQNPLLNRCEGLYIRDFNGKELIIVKEDLPNENFIIAHELGHALLHTEYDTLLHNKHVIPGKVEKEADYFATKLLFTNIKLEDWISTSYELAQYLGIKEDTVKYIINTNYKSI